MTPTALNLLGYTAASLVLATFCAKSMVTLRVLALCSNVAFVIYAIEASLWPILLLHAVMFPLNLLRLFEALGADFRNPFASGGLAPVRVLAPRSGRPR
jgi:hypothetical protein